MASPSSRASVTASWQTPVRGSWPSMRRTCRPASESSRRSRGGPAIQSPTLCTPTDMPITSVAASPSTPPTTTSPWSVTATSTSDSTDTPRRTTGTSRSTLASSGESLATTRWGRSPSSSHRTRIDPTTLSTITTCSRSVTGPSSCTMRVARPMITCGDGFPKRSGSRQATSSSGISRTQGIRKRFSGTPSSGLKRSAK